jgi:hypothetical protein
MGRLRVRISMLVHHRTQIALVGAREWQDYTSTLSIHYSENTTGYSLCTEHYVSK